MKYPETRLRRLRTDKWLRDILEDIQLQKSDLILPLFVQEGENKKSAIKSLAGISRYSIDLLLKETELAIKSGIRAVALFPVIEQDLKTQDASEAINPNNLMTRSIKAIKQEFKSEIGIIADVALDPYNSLGHDGLVINDKVANDQTNQILAKQALIFADAGCDIIAPSDMMDGRIGIIRSELEKNHFSDTKILSYAVKFSSNFYGPFRDAVNSKDSLKNSSKDTYQMSYKNSKEYLREIELDINEGADFIIIKPAQNYLDVIKHAKEKFDIPIFAYQVSGEYAMLKSAAEQGFIDYQSAQIESLIACKRAGSSAIFCYDAINIASLLND